MANINTIVGDPLLHKDIHNTMVQELLTYEFFLFVYFIHELVNTYSLSICLEPQFLYDYKDKCSYELTYNYNDTLSHQLLDLICSPEKFNVSKDFILETPYINIGLKYMERISSLWFSKDSEIIYLDNTLDWIESFLYLIQEEEQIPYIRNLLLNKSLQDKIGYSQKTKL